MGGVDVTDQRISYYRPSKITSSSRISKPKVPEAKTTTNRKRKKVTSTLSAVQQLSERSPCIMTPKELHVRSHIRCGTCVYCSAQYIQMARRKERKFVLKKIQKGLTCITHFVHLRQKMILQVFFVKSILTSFTTLPEK